MHSLVSGLTKVRRFRCFYPALLLVFAGPIATLAQPGPSPRLSLGTNTNDNAPVGFVGEFVSSSVASGSAVALTTATNANVTSISLTAGDWEVAGEVWQTLAGGASPTVGQAGISTSSTTFGSGPGTGSRAIIPATIGANQVPVIVLAPCRLSLASTTTVYLIGEALFGSGTVSAYGVITARRMR